MTNTDTLTNSARQFLESIFESQIKTVGKSKSGSIGFAGEKMITGKRTIKEEYLNDYRAYIYLDYISMKDTYGYKLGYEEMISEYAIALTIACSKLGERFPDYEILKKDMKTQKQTVSYLKQTVSKIMWHSANPDTLQTRLAGKNVTVGNDVTSTDAIQDAYTENDNGAFELSEENRLFVRDVDENDVYMFNSYIQTFLKNKEKIMTKKQLEFYENFKDNYVDKNNEFVTKKQALKEAGYTQAQYHSYIENIAKRAEDYFDKYGKKTSASEEYRITLRRVLKNYVKIVEQRTNLELYRLQTSRIVQDNYDHESFEVIILKGLTTEEKQHVVRTVKGQHYLTGDINRKIYLNIKEYLKNNPFQEVKPSEIKSTYTESLFTDEQKKNVLTHYKINAYGVTTPVITEDIVVGVNEVIYA